MPREATALRVAPPSAGPPHVRRDASRERHVRRRARGGTAYPVRTGRAPFHGRADCGSAHPAVPWHRRV